MKTATAFSVAVFVSAHQRQTHDAAMLTDLCAA
jgi:hypothetical protein